MITPKHDSFAALRHRDFSLVTLNQVFMTIAILIQEVVVAYALYKLTHDPLTLGMIGLAEAIPFILLSLWGGYVADKFNRQTIMRICVFLTLPLPLVFSGLFSAHEHGSLTQGQLVWSAYGIIFLQGMIQGFYSPASRSLKPYLVPREIYANAATWTTVGFNLGVVLGPVSAGLMYAAIGLHDTLYFVSSMLLVSCVLLTFLSSRSFPAIDHDDVWLSLKEGFDFVFKNKIIFWSISLDLVSVLLGGAVALLPIFAADILNVGAEGLGLMRASPSVGALLMMALLAKYPPTVHAWRNMLLAVGGFGVFTLVFALSKALWLSMIALALIGAFDSISVVIRQTILQIFPPENLRGRVAAVNGMFVSSSNELGAFESGVMARLMGTIPSVLLGGSLTLVILGVTWWRTRDLLGVDVESVKAHNQTAG
jgi:MFS family permease